MSFVFWTVCIFGAGYGLFWALATSQSFRRSVGAALVLLSWVFAYQAPNAGTVWTAIGLTMIAAYIIIRAIKDRIGSGLAAR
ncbi:MAG TPA: hypothetical protein VGG68_00035 [Caulobacteraceae bacterium]|jgi:hypothetical protein